jgi:hypothetical protein
VYTESLDTNDLLYHPCLISIYQWRSFKVCYFALVARKSTKNGSDFRRSQIEKSKIHEDLVSCIFVIQIQIDGLALLSLSPLNLESDLSHSSLPKITIEHRGPPWININDTIQHIISISKYITVVLVYFDGIALSKAHSLAFQRSKTC